MSKFNILIYSPNDTTNIDTFRKLTNIITVIRDRMLVSDKHLSKLFNIDILDSKNDINEHCSLTNIEPNFKKISDSHIIVIIIQNRSEIELYLSQFIFMDDKIKNKTIFLLDKNIITSGNETIYNILLDKLFTKHNILCLFDNDEDLIAESISSKYTNFILRQNMN